MEKKKEGTQKNLWQKFRNRPVLFNFVLIVLFCGICAVASFFAMSWGTRHDARRTVPDFSGMTLNEAQQFAESYDLEVVVNDSLYVQSYPGGAVLDQLPDEGVIVKPGRKVYVTINSFRQRMVEVPYVAGYSLRQAKNMLELVGLSIERIEYTHDLATNYVLAQFVGDKKVLENSKLQAEKGSGVVLRVGVSSSARPLVSPTIIGRSLVEAKSRLWDIGLNVGDITYDDGIAAVDRSRAKVCWQSVSPGRPISYGAKVSMLLTLDNKKIESALQGHNVKAMEAKLEADSIAHAKQQRFLDSLAELEAVKPLDSLEMAAAEAEVKASMETIVSDEE